MLRAPKAKDAKRVARRLGVLERRLSMRQRAQGKKKAPRKDEYGPSSRWESVADTYPRVEMYIFFLSYQGLAQSASQCIANPEAHIGSRIFASIVFAVVMVGGLVSVARFVLKKVQGERRAVLVRDKKSGYLAWMDRAGAVTNARGYTGFVARNGAMFEVRTS